MNSTVKNIIFWVVMVATAVLLWAVVKASTGQKPAELTFTQFTQEIDKGTLKQLTIDGSEVSGVKKDNTKFKTIIPANYPDVYKQLEGKGVNVTIKDNSGNTWLSWIGNGILPLLIIVGIWIFFMRQMQTGGNKALSFGKSRARLLSTQQKKVTFKDVAGVDEAKDELHEIIDFLKEPQKFQKLGGRIPKGVLLVGPPGTGKTLLARAIAGEANVPFFSIAGSDFVEMFVGVGASRVRDLFEQGKKNAPCIIFIDEIDAVGRHRGAGLGGGHDEREQTLNQLLVEMDGFESNEGVILIAATNRPDVLDPALLRPGRFDRRVVVPRPDVGGREGVLKVHTKKIPLAEDVNIPVLARGTPGFSGADLANLVNEAALLAAREDRRQVTMWDFEAAKDKVLMGTARKSMILSDEEKKTTAYHEAGHALVALMVPYADPLHKVTIIPRGMALGVTMQLPLDDKHTYSRDYLESQLAIMMGGRLAEEIFLGHITTGAGNDIEQATEIARKMVCEYGMSDLGPLAYGKNQQEIFLGRDLATQRDFSEDTQIKIDQEVKKFVMTGYQRAKEILGSHREAMARVAEALLVHEVLDGSDVRLLLEGKPLPERRKPEPAIPPPGEPATTQVLKPQVSPASPAKERPQPA
ncbi:MAG: ATP-dependent zinc metalloprotease FtsH [Terriglobia bacterium]